mgnify:CR=1 FL=1
MKRASVVVVVGLLLLATATAVLAGGWAVVTLDSPPGEIHAGEPWTVGFTVLQHGQTPVHNLGPGNPVEPLLIATNADGRRVEAQATPTDEIGHFVAEVTFPTEGAWEWTIHPNPLAGETLFEPLTVMAALPAAEEAAVAAQPAATAAAGSDAGPAGALRWAALALALVAVALLIVQSRRRPAAVKS